jgi:hypothetical protein
MNIGVKYKIAAFEENRFFGMNPKFLMIPECYVTGCWGGKLKMRCRKTTAIRGKTHECRSDFL